MNDLVDEIIDIAEKHFNREVKLCETPAAHSKLLESGTGEDIDPQMYQKIAGKLMYLCTKMMNEGSNASCELSKIFMHPKAEHWRALEYFVGYLKAEKENLCLTY